MKTVCMLAATLIVLSACGSDRDTGASDGENADGQAQEKLAERGQDIFRDRGFGEIEIACIDCHADFDEALAEEDRIRPGHSILGAHKRAETWNGEFSGAGLQRTAAGAAKCAWLYQEKGSSVEDALTEDEAAALMAYYAYVSPGNEPPLLSWDAVTWPGDPDFDAEIFEKEMEAIADLRGSAPRGETMFARACAPCHDNGLGPATRIIRRKAGQVPAVVRAGEDTMPFFSRDRLSDQDIADIQEFLSR